MEVNVILANMEGGSQEIRRVFVDAENKSEIEILNDVFENGQNMFSEQKNIRSVSIGDMIELNKKFFLVNSLGFIKQGDKADLSPMAILYMNQKGNLLLKEKFGYLLKE